MSGHTRRTIGAALWWLAMVGCTTNGGVGPAAVADAATDATSATDATDATSTKGADVASPIDLPLAVDASASDVPVMRAADGGALPNLTPVIQNTQIQERSFGASACEVMEGCTVAGSRRLLRFDLLTPNVGEADLYLGPPTTAGRPSAMFEYGTCHRHWHLRGYADYRLFDLAGAEVGRGHKQSFCLLDSGRYMGMGADIPAASRYGCSDQGIHAGWYDAYGRSLDCQYVDITGVPAGTYRLRAQINIERVVAESRYDDNEMSMMVVIPPRPVGPDGGLLDDPTLACSSDEQGVDRDCGWVREGDPRTCTPGARVQIGCNAGCVPPIGLCVGDPMLRVCAGDRPCMRDAQLAANDDSCAGGVDGGPDTHLCPTLAFTCPTGGRYTVLSGAFRSGGAYECHFDVR